MDDWWSTALHDTFAGRRVIIAGAVPAAWHEHVHHLRAAGAADIMILATGGIGVGVGPAVETHAIEPPPGASTMERIRFENEVLADPPADIVRVLDEFDPDGDAIVCGGFLNESPTLAGRPVLAPRRPEWVRLEDKTVIDEFWDRAGIERRRSVVVPLTDARHAASQIDEGCGTVWAADARDGFHGGADATRWIVDENDADRAEAELRTRCDRVRVMPFLHGIACSIHGLVDESDVAVLRPVEMVTLQRGRQLVYAGCATFWDPPDDIRSEMRSVARRAGARLREEVDFRGTFTIDGVARPDGFWPTELNPRFGAGLNTIARATGDIPILLIHDLIVAGRSPGLSMSELEARLIEHADTHRAGGTWRLLTAPTPTPTATPTTTSTTTSIDRVDQRPVTAGRNAWHWSNGEHDATSNNATSSNPAEHATANNERTTDDPNHDDPIDGIFSAGPGFARCWFEPSRTPVGPSVAERAAAFWRFAEPELGIGDGTLAAPSDPFARRR